MVRWTEVRDAGRALEGIEDGEYAGAIVVPQNYSERLAGLAAPPGAEAVLPARLELLINPEVAPSTEALLRQAYSGIVRETSMAASAEMTGSLERAGASVPAERAPLLGDPVREEVREARPQDGAVAPRTAGASSAHVEILTNPSAGPFASDAVEGILSGVVDGASDDVGERITGVLASNGAQVSPGRIAALAQPIRAEVTDPEPLGENSGRGLTPFYLMFTASLLGFIGANVIQVNAETLREEALRAGRRPLSWTGTFSAKAVLSLVLALLLGAVEALVAFGIYGLHREASVFGLFALLALIAAASLFVALLLLTVAGYRLGVLLGSLFIISLGLATSGGTTPVQNLPEVLRTVADALPFKHATDGARAMLFYEGRVEAGLGSALWVLSAYVVGSALLGATFSMARDAFAGGKPKFDGGKAG